MDLEPKIFQETKKQTNLQILAWALTLEFLTKVRSKPSYFNLLDFSLVSPSLQHPAIRKAIFALLINHNLP